MRARDAAPVPPPCDHAPHLAALTDAASMTPIERHRPNLNGTVLLTVAVLLLVLVAIWWWAFAGEGRQRFRAAQEPAPAETSP